MLANAPIRAYIPVLHVARARKFYEKTVGLKPKQDYAGGVVYECGGTEVFMYPLSTPPESDFDELWLFALDQGRS
jgi:hypothetical protein